MLVNKLSELWCLFMHDSTMWPIHGRYQCGDCGRIYQVPWTESGATPKHTRLPALKQALAQR